jgi:hypothetical protein
MCKMCILQLYNYNEQKDAFPYIHVFRAFSFSIIHINQLKALFYYNLKLNTIYSFVTITHYKSFQLQNILFPDMFRHTCHAIFRDRS